MTRNAPGVWTQAFGARLVCFLCRHLTYATLCRTNGFKQLGVSSQAAEEFAHHQLEVNRPHAPGEVSQVVLITVFSRLRTSAALVVTVGTRLAQGCPWPAIVAAFRLDARTVAAWWARAGQQGQAVHLITDHTTKNFLAFVAVQIRHSPCGCPGTGYTHTIEDEVTHAASANIFGDYLCSLSIGCYAGINDQ